MWGLGGCGRVSVRRGGDMMRRMGGEDLDL